VNSEIIQLDQKFVANGIFWDPKKTERDSFSATLSYVPEEGIELEAATTAVKPKDFLSFKDDEIELPAGALADGTPCSLFRVQLLRNTKTLFGRMADTSNSVFHVRFAVIGEAAEGETQPRFHELDISYEAGVNGALRFTADSFREQGRRRNSSFSTIRRSADECCG